MGTAKKIARACWAALGATVLITSLADMPARMAIWHGWFTFLSPHLHTLKFRWFLGCVGILICLAPWIWEWTTKLYRKDKTLALELIPHGNNSHLLCLEVKNKGDDIRIAANIRVVSRSYGGPVDTRPYVGQWALIDYKRRFGDHRPQPTTGVVTIPSGNNRILEIAKQAPENGNGNEMSAAYLVGSDEFLRWDFERRPNSHLPSFRLQIEFLAEGVSKPLCKLYDVGPINSYGPLGMTEVFV